MFQRSRCDFYETRNMHRQEIHMERQATSSYISFEQHIDDRRSGMNTYMDMEEPHICLESENRPIFQMDNQNQAEERNLLVNNTPHRKRNLRKRSKRHRSCKSWISPLLRDELQLDNPTSKEQKQQIKRRNFNTRNRHQKRGTSMPDTSSLLRDNLEIQEPPLDR